MLEHCGITFSWGTEFGKGGPILAAKIGPGGPFLAADRFFRYRPYRLEIISSLIDKALREKGSGHARLWRGHLRE